MSWLGLCLGAENLSFTRYLGFAWLGTGSTMGPPERISRHRTPCRAGPRRAALAAPDVAARPASRRGTGQQRGSTRRQRRGSTEGGRDGGDAPAAAELGTAIGRHKHARVLPMAPPRAALDTTHAGGSPQAMPRPTSGPDRYAAGHDFARADFGAPTRCRANLGAASLSGRCSTSVRHTRPAHPPK
jgi:hypothetical protein